MEFVIPLQRGDLENAGDIGQYVVERVLDVQDIPPAIKGCSESLSKDGPAFIIDNFDALYSCLSKFTHLKASVRKDVWKVLLKAFGSLISDLGLVLDEETDAIDEDTRSRAATVLKMISYLVCQLTILFEDEDTKLMNDVALTAGKKGRTKSKCKPNGDCNWSEKKLKAVTMMRELCLLPLHRLWSPPIIDDEFLNLFSNCCYKMLESDGLNRTKDLKESIFHLLGQLLKKYRNTLSGAVKIVQLLHQNEHVALPLAQATVIFVEKYDIKNLLNQIVREIGTMGAKDFAVESIAIRSFSVFLLEITRHLPNHVLSNMAILSTHLDEEPYGMRNCVLAIMGEILLKTHSSLVANDAAEGDEIDERSRLMRDQFLDYLEVHLHDVNAFVRCRALTIWTELFSKHAVPLDRYQPILELVVGRLQDKSSLVRKNAISVVSAILRANPFGANFSMKALTDQYDKEVKKLKAMCPTEDLDVDENSSGDETRSERWMTNEAAIKVCLGKMIAKNASNNLNKDPPVAVVSRFRSLIEADQHACALALLFENPDTESLNCNKNGFESTLDHEDLSHSSFDSQDSSNCSIVDHLMESIKNIYIGDNDGQATDIQAAADEIDRGEHRQANVEENVASKVAAQKMIVKYLKDSLKFRQLLNKAMPLLCQLLSGHTTDIVMAIEFFVLAKEHGMLEAMIGIRKMLPLVWSQDKHVKESVVAAFKRIYLDCDSNETPHVRFERITNTFINLINGAGGVQRSAMGELVCELIKSGDLPHDVCKCMWTRFANGTKDFSTEDSNAAIVFLGMAADADKNIIENNLQLLSSFGLGDRSKCNFEFRKNVCIALSKFGGATRPSVEKAKTPPRLPHNHLIFQRLADILIDGIGRIQDEMYIPMAEQVVNVIYKLAEHPEMIGERILVRIVDNLTAPAKSSDDKNLCPPQLLARLISLCGHVALCQMIHLDVNIFTELKRRRHIVEENDKTKESKKRTNKKHGSSSASAHRAPNDKVKSEPMDDDCGMAGATADDADAECVGKVCENLLITCNGNLLAKVAPVIVTIASNPGQFENRKLQSAACLALAKYMMVSSSFCDENMQLLITILEKSESPMIRANIVVTLGDLCCRFPNVVEPWTPHLYARLSDRNFEVRRNAILVLTHLILHDMIKAKGQICDLALCAIDEDDRIAGQAKLFFKELSQKANAIFNLMPEIVTRMSDENVGTTETKFQAVMKYLLPFVQKDRLVESLVEKLMQRFPLTSSERQWRDLAFCMPELCRNPKCYSIILENIAFVADKLYEETVYKHFCDVVAVAKKTCKPDSQTTLDELEEKIQHYHDKGVDEEAVASAAGQAAQGRVLARKASNVDRTQRGTGKKTAQKPSRGRFKTDSDDDFCSAKDVGNRISTRPQNRRKRLPVVFSSDSESDTSVPSRKSPNSDKLTADTSSSDLSA